MRSFKKRIYTQHLITNYHLLKKKAGGALVVPVVKADAYGHSAKIVVKALMDEGIDYVAVAYSGEALQLKKWFPDIQIQVMGVFEKIHVKKLIALDIEMAVSDVDSLQVINAGAKQLKRRPGIHIKMDTGMNRLGFRFDRCTQIAEICRRLTHVEFKGIMSHFACADTPNHPLNKLQIERFKQCIDIFKQQEITFTHRHICNSGGIFNFPEAHFNMVRAGISLYGYTPGPETMIDKKLSPVMEVCGKISHVKSIKKGEAVSYGAGWNAPSDGYLAVIPIGYGDGYPRSLSNGAGKIRIHDKFYLICGRVCMDQLMVFSRTEEFKVGDDAYLLDIQSNSPITADDLAQATGTISYEILCGFLPRLPVEEV